MRLQVFGVHVTNCMLCVAFRWKTYFSVVNLIWIIFRLKEIVSKNVWAHQICSQLTSCLNLWKCSVITFLFDMLDLTQKRGFKKIFIFFFEFQLITTNIFLYFQIYHYWNCIGHKFENIWKYSSHWQVSLFYLSNWSHFLSFIITQTFVLKGTGSDSNEILIN